MIEDLRGFEYQVIEEMGYTIYDEIGRKQNGDGTWAKIHKEGGKFITTGTRYGGESFEKREYREVYDTIEDFKTGSVSKEQ
jgi:hypothetical protein